MKRIFCLFIILLSALHFHFYTVNAAQVWWGYWNSGLGLTEVAPFEAGQNECCARVVATAVPQLMGAQLHAIRFYVSDKTAITSARVWVSSTEWGSDKAEVEVQLSALRDIMHDGSATEVALPEAVTLLHAANRYASTYVGFTLTIASGQPPCYMLAAPSHTSAFTNIARINGQRVELGATNGALALQMLVSSDQLTANSVSPVAPETFVAVAGEDCAQALPLRLDGSTAVSDVDYEVYMDDKLINQQHYDLPSPHNELFGTTDIPVRFTVPSTPQQYSYSVRLTHVNGEPNTSATPASEAVIATVVSQLGERRVVMEEATATWCNNCTRGIVGMQRLHEIFGDRFIGIAMHGSDDPMLLRTYRASRIGKKMPSLPIAYLDRRLELDPYMGTHALNDMHFYADEAVREHLAHPSVADISLSASWSDASRSTIDVEALTTFRYNAETAPYGIVLLLLEDGMSGEGRDWMQINGYSSSQDRGELDADMQAFVDAPYYIYNYVFNHVAVGVLSPDDGIPGSITAPLQADTPQRFALSWDIADNTLIQDKSQLHLVALLVSHDTTEIVNAASAEIAGGGDGISPIGMKNEELGMKNEADAVYDLSGRRVGNDSLQMTNAGSRRGIFISGRKKIIVN
ncbi:MAG: hypothetical protein IJ209_03025 [Bacteroidaceae bacterium]|nr:hypothetical protein [Bacteroidaceae bacterium]